MKNGAANVFLEPCKSLFSRIDDDMCEVLNNTFDYNSSAEDYLKLINLTQEKAIEAYDYIFFKKCAVFEYHITPECMLEQNQSDKEERIKKLQNQEVGNQKLVRNLEFYDDFTQLKSKLGFYEVQHPFV